MEQEIIIGARKTKANKSDELNIERFYSLVNFRKYVLNFQESQIENLIKNAQISEIKQRFNIWRILLKIMPQDNQENMLNSLKNQRDYYNNECIRLQPIKKEVTQRRMTNNPLQQRQINQPNPYENFFEDNELKHSIKIDIERTYQDIEFFKNLQIKNVLNNILFIWSKQNSQVSYKQGMNELVAILTYIYYTECMEKNEQQDQDISLYQDFMHEQHVEADVYTVFDKLMKLGQVEMFSNTKNISPIHQIYKSNSLEDVLFQLEKFECGSTKMQKNFRLFIDYRQGYLSQIQSF